MKGTTMDETVSRLRNAINRHDLQGMADLFASDYRSEQPLHPNRGFGGRGQVATNWRAMFAGVPDLVAEVLADATVGRTTWSEWVWRGSHQDGSAFLMRGVVVSEVRDDGLIASARLYMEPVEQGGAGIDASVEQISRPSR